MLKFFAAICALIVVGLIGVFFIGYFYLFFGVIFGAIWELAIIVLYVFFALQIIKMYD